MSNLLEAHTDGVYLEIDDEKMASEINFRLVEKCCFTCKHYIYERKSKTKHGIPFNVSKIKCSIMGTRIHGKCTQELDRSIVCDKWSKKS